MIGFSASLFLLPIMLQAERGMSPFQSGLTTFPMAIGVMLMAQPTSRFYRIVGPTPADRGRAYRCFAHVVRTGRHRLRNEPVDDPRADARSWLWLRTDARASAGSATRLTRLISTLSSAAGVRARSLLAPRPPPIARFPKRLSPDAD